MSPPPEALPKFQSLHSVTIFMLTFFYLPSPLVAIDKAGEKLLWLHSLLPVELMPDLFQQLWEAPA